ncbi:unnamed protein product [Ectocarpus sp. CCAP 1310/34]|nr:unnamed protein product [Ectocarpus sp. CCAP 1310/34]
MDVFVCICTVVTDDWVGNNDEAVFFWVGRYATLALQEHGAKVLMALMEYYCMPADFNVSILEEDELYDDHAQLWDDLSEMLGGEVAWANWNGVFDEDEFDADEDLGVVPKLYVADTGTGNVMLTHVGHVQRECLLSETVAVLDTVEGVYVWRGFHADSSQFALICRACEEYCRNKPLPVGRKVIKVREGQEPLVFRARFQSWDDGGPGEAKKFQDVYEQRVVQMSKEGTLGDMSALRGRVLGDEEAAQYWEERGAAPGGQGVRSGVFRDDPASRSTQRRGAPGRKAWVKPPPKPVVVDKTKELDAKRNFLALKDRFEGTGGSSAEAFNKPTTRTFSRRSLLEARQESIKLGTSTKFKEADQQQNTRGLAATGRRQSWQQQSDQQGGEDGDPWAHQAEPAEVDPHVFLSRHSWGSASSARRRHNAVMEAEAAAAQVRKSLESAAAPPAPAPRGRRGSSSARRASFDSSARSSSSHDGRGSLDSAAGSFLGAKSSFESAAASSASAAAANGSPPVARPGGPARAGVGGWVREEIASSRGAGSCRTSHPPSPGRSGASRGGRVVGRWVRRSGSRDSSLSVSPDLPPRKPAAAGATAPAPAPAVMKAGDEAVPPSAASAPASGGEGVRRNVVSRDSTAAEVEVDGGRRSSVGSAAGLAVAAVVASFARDAGSDARAPPKEDGRAWSKPTAAAAASYQTKQQLLEARWKQRSQGGGESFEGEAYSRAAVGGGTGTFRRRSRSRSGSVVDNEGLQASAFGALEQAEKEEERRRSSAGHGPTARGSTGSGKASFSRPGSSGGADGVGAEEQPDERGRTGGGGAAGAGKERHARTGRASGGGSAGGDAAVRDDDKAATAYSLALARVRRETVQEGLRKGGHNVPAEEGDNSKMNKPTVVSIKHTMSRVKARGIAGAGAGAGGSGGGPAVSDRPAPGETRISDGSRLKAALRASIESQTSSREGLGEMEFNDGDDDDEDEDDLDSPRHRGRQYDDRWKMPGKAESVLASFVERLEHRGLAVDGGESGGSGSSGGEAGGGGGRDSTESYGETSASAALAEARANRHAAVAVLSRNTRLQSERSTRNSPGPLAALAADGSSGGRRRKSSKGGGGGGGGGGGASRGGTGRRSRGKGAGPGKDSGKGEPAGKGGSEAAAEAATGEEPRYRGTGSGGSSGGGGGGGAWSKIGSIALSSIQRAAEVIVGGGPPKDASEEEELQKRAEVERTRNAVSVFLSARGASAEDQE